ncbi:MULTISPECIES: SMI1/KNR4 family protein [unclassified Lentimonas]|uniref:SMI1/KNR4 family protein n=1 Tax=unclassified Lentimonas TaxID=2630993 RepID=UPI001321AF20|nr:MULTISPECIES: SMI1/KNR4 family protein [unclassified Lentimonas]CAA6680153.1 Unannotated [Lentimonas sp. CC4]CAA6685579.1 Unannotated [Lentimonas sp. CC6]CAA6689676.1 Unannotated [Lentimonas sp. CC19]CAA6692704.1 Unannotated [Lentimonas sp. CC10]CAA7069265.1 Unannotated [Lentimonas sp. CC11]
MLSFKNSTALPSEGDILELESKLNIQLPEDYRAFLKETNGGRPSLELYDQSFVLKELWSLGSKPPWDLSHRNKFFEETPKYFEIGFSACGDSIAIQVKGKNKGRIVWFDHEVEPSLFRSNLRTLSDSFTKFLDQLKQM